MAPRLSTFLFLLVAYGLRALAMDRVWCNLEISQKLDNRTLLPDDPIFFRDNHERPMSVRNNIGLTLEGCRAQCGSKFDWYHDVGPRLSTWLFPVILLIGNMQLATFGVKNSLLTIIHVLGDPIDSMWSLLTKLEVWNRCYDLAESLSRIGGRNKDHVRDRATILAAIQELEGPCSNPEQTYNWILRNSTIDGNNPDRPALHHLCREIANELSDSNTLQLPRAWLAILSYVITVLGAFVQAIGGTPSSQPGGRIGTAMFLSWLIPFVLLSNTVGCFTSRRTCLRTMERFAKATKPAGQAFPEIRRSSDAHSSFQSQISLGPLGSPSPQPQSPAHAYGIHGTPLLVADRRGSDYFSSAHQRNPSFELPAAARPSSPMTRSADWLDLQLFSQDKPSQLLRKPRVWTPFTDAQPWWGAIYTYQPSKTSFHVVSLKNREQSPLSLFLLGTSPFIIALAISFLIIWFTPTIGLTCRHFPLFGIFGAWLLSVGFTLLTSNFCTGKYHWRLTLIKDAIIAFPSLVMIFLSSSGLFNSCWCWSSVYSRGIANAVILLDPDPARKRNAETIYPGLVGTGLILHTLFFAVACHRSKRGRSLLRRSEKIKNLDFWVLHRPKISSGQPVRPTAGGYELKDRTRASESERVPFL